MELAASTVMLTQGCPHLPAAHSLGEVGSMGAAENAVHKRARDSKPKGRICFAVIMTVDPFLVIYSGHLDASGRKQTIREHREGKASRKTFELLIM